jgi:hypothetical protein
MGHRTPLTNIEAVSAELAYAQARAEIESRLAINGPDAKCADCPSKCKQIANQDNNAVWECWRNPGPLTKSYWSRRLAGAKEAAQMRRMRGTDAAVRSPRPDSRPATNAKGDGNV